MLLQSCYSTLSQGPVLPAQELPYSLSPHATVLRRLVCMYIRTVECTNDRPSTVPHMIRVHLELHLTRHASCSPSLAPLRERETLLAPPLSPPVLFHSSPARGAESDVVWARFLGTHHIILHKAGPEGIQREPLRHLASHCLLSLVRIFPDPGEQPGGKKSWAGAQPTRPRYFVVASSTEYSCLPSALPARN